MPRLITHQTVTVIRDGNRVKVKPTPQGAIFDFTDDEVAAIEAGGGRLTAPAGPASAPTVVSKAKKAAAEAPVEPERPMTAAEKKAAAKAAAEAAKADPEDDL